MSHIATCLLYRSCKNNFLSDMCSKGNYSHCERESTFSSFIFYRFSYCLLKIKHNSLSMIKKFLRDQMIADGKPSQLIARLSKEQCYLLT